MNLILACDKNGGIGYQNRLPWIKIQGDLPRFKALTEGQPVIMGRNTWDSLPRKPLPGRLNIVVSSRPLYPTIDEYPPGTIQIPEPTLDLTNTWCIGGAKLTETLWDQITEIHLTRLFTQYTCDTHINLLQVEQDFKLVHYEYLVDHQYQIWRRKT